MAVLIVLGVEVVHRVVPGSAAHRARVETRRGGRAQIPPAPSGGPDLRQQALRGGTLFRAGECDGWVLLQAVLIPPERPRRQLSRVP
jgi:hypothetical protein